MNDRSMREASPERLANLVLIGPPRTGSTSLFHYLSQHPQICPSPIKEPNYFGGGTFSNNPLMALEQYMRLFDGCGRQRYRMEASVAYFFHAELITKEVQELLEDARIVVCLREPIERMLSNYWLHRSRLTYGTDLRLEQYLARVRQFTQTELRDGQGVGFWGMEGGKYIEYVRPWQEEFGERLRIQFFDDLRADPRSFFDRLIRWLDLQPEDVPEMAIDTFNRSANIRNLGLQRIAIAINDGGEVFWRRYPGIKRAILSVYYRLNARPFFEELSLEARLELEAFYDPYNRRLADYLIDLGYRDLPVWLQYE